MVWGDERCCWGGEVDREGGREGGKGGEVSLSQNLTQ